MSTVRFYDVENKRVITIPASELAPGSVQVRLNGNDEVVWMESRHLQAPSVPKHQELAQELKDAIRRIMENFQDQNPMPYEEWEEGFRCDAHPEQEIAYWLKASAVFRHHAKAMEGAGQRAELYHLVGCCLNSNRENLPRIYQRTLLDPAKVQSVLDTYYGPG